MRLIALIFATAIAFPAFAETPKTIDILWHGDAAIADAENLLKEKKYAEVLNATDKMTIRNIRNSDAHVLAATAWYNLGNMDKAKTSVDNALAIDQGHMGAYLVASLIALQKKEKQQAEYYLNAMKVVCQSANCPEYQYLQKIIREYKE